MERKVDKFSRNTALLITGNRRYVYRRDRDAEQNGKIHVFEINFTLIIHQLEIRKSSFAFL